MKNQKPLSDHQKRGLGEAISTLQNSTFEILNEFLYLKLTFDATFKNTMRHIV